MIDAFLGSPVQGSQSGELSALLGSTVRLTRRTARERPRLPLRREVDFCPFRGKKTEGERTRGCCLHKGVGVHKVIQVSLLFSSRLYLLLSQILGVSLPPSRRFNPLYAVPPPSSEGGEAATAAPPRFPALHDVKSSSRLRSSASFATGIPAMRRARSASGKVRTITS